MTGLFGSLLAIPLPDRLTGAAQDFPFQYQQLRLGLRY
ncbi:hypothetical protein ADIMK_4052 [Marinobacterium lacunae]|uniref:Uncharacterized protein n=1 Tax=Marinobacterium lacunae TaxID=1232683 RepID=A0A081FTQ0_9GAMM|nr:hypothetical protein ADIMK_4052 [Marinobacterium lacunae]